MDDEELAAAIAHEVGHLASKDRRRAVLTLRGRHHGLEAELEADQIGVDLLRAAGIQPTVMAVMLSKVRDAACLQPAYVAEMDRRIRRLRGTPALGSR